MFHRYSPWLGALATVFLFGMAAVAQDQEPQPPPGVDVLTRGPVHEAFMTPVQGEPQPNPIAPKAPPDPIQELPPDQKPEGNNVQWIPGYWAWDDHTADYIWISGAWRDVPPGKRWVPGHWNQVQDGWQWVSGFWADAAVEQVHYLPPPPANIDNGPSAPAPDPSYIYSPGVWVYQTTGYAWRPGFWIAPRAEWVWIPAHYVWTPAGVVFVDGYWDFEIRRRGLLFAPVRFEAGIWRQPGFVYRPAWAIAADFLLDALFVRPTYGCYYFGDFFAPGYERAGFVPWYDYHVGRFAHDPIYAHYRWEHREDREWEQRYKTVYVERRDGKAPRPPHTFAQQKEYIQRIEKEKVIPGAKPFAVRDPQQAIKSVSAVTHVTKVPPTTMKMTPIPKEQIPQYHKSAQDLHNFSQQRSKAETQFRTEKPPPMHPTDKLPNTQLTLPKIQTPPPLHTPTTPALQVPMHPTPPPHVQQQFPQYHPPQPIKLSPQPHNPELEQKKEPPKKEPPKKPPM